MTPNEMMEALEATATVTAFLTGVKADLESKGWSRAAAEQIVVTLLASSMVEGGKK